MLILLFHVMVNTVTQHFRVSNLEHKIRVVVHRGNFSLHL